ncbi:MAG: DNA alkylation response protein [Deltaproteobacteria bacterium]|nr:MAG: DNA alkylation response protein [Deltaproteobacteria bacterium]
MTSDTPFRVLARPRAQSPNFYRQDPVLRRLLPTLVSQPAHDWLAPQLDRMGAAAASAHVNRLSDVADKQSPVLRRYDPLGNRIDAIDYHPAYRELEELAYGSGMIACKYDPELRARFPGDLQVAGFALTFLFAQTECGLSCPVCMTDGVARLIELFGDDAQKRTYIPRLAARDRDALVRGAMFLTEKQGGSDVGANATRAVRDGDRFRLYGEKWFCSNVDAEAILILARPDGAPGGTRGLGLFLMLRDLPDGTRNGYRIERLKDKLGVRSMPTGEVVIDGAVAEQVGALDRGFKQMAEMLNLSRLYNAFCSVSIVRRAAFEATDYLRARDTFGKPAIGHPLVRENLADLHAEEIAAKHAVFHLADQLDRADTGSERDAHLVRMLTPMVKYTTAKLAVWAASEGIELVGGNGYIEDSVMPRLLRDAQVLPVWEGTTNILVLDTLRAASKGCHTALFDETDARLARASGPEAERVGDLARWTRAELAEFAGLSPDQVAPRAKRWADRTLLAYELATLLATGDAVDAAAARRLIRRHIDPDAPVRSEDIDALVDGTVGEPA